MDRGAWRATVHGVTTDVTVCMHAPQHAALTTESKEEVKSP